MIVASDGIFIAGGLMMGFARTDVELIVGRAVVGVGIGVASIVVPVYIAEVSPKGIRAMLIVLYSLQIGVGLVRCLGHLNPRLLSSPRSNTKPGLFTTSASPLPLRLSRLSAP